MPSSRDQDLADFFQSMLDICQRNSQEIGESQFDFNIAGRGARIRFAGESLLHLARPLAHRLRSPIAGTDRGNLEIFVCEGTAAKMDAPSPPWRVQQVNQERMHHWRLESGDILVNHMPAYGFLCLFDRRTQRAIYWVDDADQLPFWETAAPLLVIFSWWAADFGGQIAHAAAVGRNDKGLLLVGRGGSGKSTTAAACLDAGLEYASDDYVLLTCDPHPKAHCLFSSAKLHTHVLDQHFPEWRSHVSEHVGPDNKAVFFLDTFRRAQLRDALNICGIARPKITQRAETRWSLAPKSEVMLELGPSTLLQLPGRKQHGLSFLARLIRQLPAYRLELGPVQTAPAAIESLLAERVQRAA